MVTKRAFTIWELLCVIAVIAIFIGLLMPALSRVRRYSTKIICASYLYGYGKAGQQYLSDNDDQFPSGPDEWLYTKASISNEHPIGCRWHDRAMARDGEIIGENAEYKGKMWAYFDEMSLGPCPIFQGCALERGCENPEHSKGLDINPQSSYVINGYLGSTEAGGVLRMSDVRDPSEVIFFAEENSWSLRPDHNKYPAEWLSAPLSTRALDDTVLRISPTPEARDCFATYHDAPYGDINRGHSNVVFIDGHVELIRAEDQLRKNMHGGDSRLGPAGNLSLAWASKSPPPSGWDAQ